MQFNTSFRHFKYSQLKNLKNLVIQNSLLSKSSDCFRYPSLSHQRPTVSSNDCINSKLFFSSPEKRNLHKTSVTTFTFFFLFYLFRRMHIYYAFIGAKLDSLLKYSIIFFWLKTSLRYNLLTCQNQDLFTKLQSGFNGKSLITARNSQKSEYNKLAFWGMIDHHFVK